MDALNEFLFDLLQMIVLVGGVLVFGMMLVGLVSAGLLALLGRKS